MDRGVSVKLLSCVQLFVTPWAAACQASLSIGKISLSFGESKLQELLMDWHATVHAVAKSWTRLSD